LIWHNACMNTEIGSNSRSRNKIKQKLNLSPSRSPMWKKPPKSFIYFMLLLTFGGMWQKKMVEDPHARVNSDIEFQTQLLLLILHIYLPIRLFLCSFKIKIHSSLLKRFHYYNFYPFSPPCICVSSKHSPFHSLHSKSYSQDHTHKENKRYK